MAGQELSIILVRIFLIYPVGRKGRVHVALLRKAKGFGLCRSRFKGPCSSFLHVSPRQYGDCLCKDGGFREDGKLHPCGTTVEGRDAGRISKRSGRLPRSGEGLLRSHLASELVPSVRRYG